MRLIDADAAIDEIVNTVSSICRYDNTAASYGAALRQNEIIDIIEKLPSAQPEIVRCKDCKHCEDYGNGYTSRCTLGNLMDDVLGFCSDAERIEDAEIY